MTYRVKVMKHGPIRTMNGAYGPIITPFNISSGMAASLINEGAKLIQVRDDGSEKELTASDIYDAPTTEQVKTEPVVEQAKVETPVAETSEAEEVVEIEEAVEDAPVLAGEDESVEESENSETHTTEGTQPQQYNNNKKKKKRYV